MAIPFNLPSDDTTLEQYRSIHQLLLDLTAILRSVLARNPEWIRAEATSNTTNNNSSNLVNNNTSNPVMAAQQCPHHHVHQQPMQNANPQFGLPLSPPNSQPGSPSPFFTSATASSAAPVFVLPDVVSSAARTLNELAPYQLQPNAAVNINNEDCAPISQRLRKRKRGSKLTKKKKPQELDLAMNDGSMAYSCEKHRKIPKTTYSSSTCSCFYDAAVFAATDDASGFDEQIRMQMQQQQQQQQQAFYPDVPRFLNGDDCSCGQPLPSDYKIPICMHVGEELRRIVECFRSPRKIGNISNDDLVDGDVKVSGFFTQFGRTMFTAALLVIGWKLLKQN